MAILKTWLAIVSSKLGNCDKLCEKTILTNSKSDFTHFRQI